MATINRNIRYYQPNDPYYWEVDNLPLTDLLSNDVVLENRITSLEAFLGGLGGGTGTPQGSISLEAIADLKAWTEPLSGLAANLGKIFVRPGKFTSRMQLPATRESGWRMMRDESRVFNNEDFFQPNSDMLNTTTLTGMVRGSQGMARTAVVEFYPNIDGTDKSIPIESFDAVDFNGGAAPSERVDLIFIRGSKALDTDGDTPTTPTGYLQQHVPTAGIGIVKGAYFRTDVAGGVHTNGTRFTTPISRNYGRTTGMGIADMPPSTNLPGFGTVPMPDDLNNFAWHSTADTSVPALAEMQVTTQATFSLPVAYVRVPSNYQEGDPIPPENIVDIRPFLRSAELTGSERQAIATSWDPNGTNPFLTRSHFLTYYTPLESRVTSVENSVAAVSGAVDSANSTISLLASAIDALEDSVSGVGIQPTAASLNIAGRLLALEQNQGTGIAAGSAERTKFLAIPSAVFTSLHPSQIGTSITSPTTFTISGIPQTDIPNLIALQFNIAVDGGGTNTESTGQLSLASTTQNLHTVARWGIEQNNGDLKKNKGYQQTLMHSITRVNANGTWHAEIDAYAAGSNDTRWSMVVTGYIVSV